MLVVEEEEEEMYLALEFQGLHNPFQLHLKHMQWNSVDQTYIVFFELAYHYILTIYQKLQATYDTKVAISDDYFSRQEKVGRQN